jgi:hypothetical protein
LTSCFSKKAPIIGTFEPTTSTAPSDYPTKHPTVSPTLSLAPSDGPSPSPTVPIFQTVTTTVGAKSPFSGISASDLADRFAAIIAFLAAVMKKLLGPDRSNWGVRVVTVGGIAARQTKSLFEVAELFARADTDSVEVEFEFSYTTECPADGCTEDEETGAVDEGLKLLDIVETVVATGQLQQTIIDDAADVGLGEELSNVGVLEIVLEAPKIEIIDPTAYPSIESTSAPTVTASPTSSPKYDCEDSPFRFNVKKDDKVIKRYCSWAKVKRRARCNLTGVREHCPKSCWGCRNCADSTLRFKFAYNGNERFRTCEWVARKKTIERCSAVEGISATCPLTCGTCT